MEGGFKTVDLSDKEFKELIAIVYEETRIKMSEHKRALIASRIGKRLRSLKIDTYTDYVNYLKSPDGKQEIVEFTNAVTTNKTDFFRENKHFEYMKTTFLPNWEESVRKGENKNLRIWSAGCSSGEEPYTIMMTLFDYFGKNISQYDIKVLATDLDTSVIAHAMEGIYKEDVINDIPQTTLKKYFMKGVGENQGKYKVRDELKKYLSFKQINFKNTDYDIRTQFDIIFCRNVIIYFDKDFQKELFEKFYKYMKNDSYIFIGHSETLFGVSEKFKYVISNIYKRIP